MTGAVVDTLRPLGRTASGLVLFLVATADEAVQPRGAGLWLRGQEA